MKRREQQYLLTDILGNDVSPLKRATLQAGLTALRQRRQRLWARRALAVAAVLGFVVLVNQNWQPLFPRVHRGRPQNPTEVNPNQTSTVQFINDEELFALFPNRPLALVGKPGQQELVFLDENGASGSKTE